MLRFSDSFGVVLNGSVIVPWIGFVRVDKVPVRKGLYGIIACFDNGTICGVTGGLWVSISMRGWYIGLCLCLFPIFRLVLCGCRRRRLR